MQIRIPAAIAGALTALLLVGCASAAPTPATPTPDADPATFDVAAAKQHCVDTGGTVQVRQPMFGTNNREETWQKIGAPIELCRYQAVDDEAQSRIYADLATIGSDAPTLAALAYLAKPETPSDTTSNPAAVMCVAIGGAVDYGMTGDGGGLVSTDDPTDLVVNPCVFADGSFIDEWGIAYYGGGVIRGKDLTEVFLFDQTNLPAVVFQ